jgi:hypothetical protein
MNRPARGGVPPGVTPEQWSQIEGEMQHRADGPAELRRMAGFLVWSDGLRRFREARNAGVGAAELAPLAQELDDGLSERLRQRELSAAEARQVKSAILETTVADPAQRSALLRQWADAEFAAPVPDPRQAAFERRQATVAAAWSAQPAAGRDPAALARDLDALRSQSFSHSGR